MSFPPDPMDYDFSFSNLGRTVVQSSYGDVGVTDASPFLTAVIGETVIGLNTTNGFTDEPHFDVNEAGCIKARGQDSGLFFKQQHGSSEVYMKQRIAAFFAILYCACVSCSVDVSEVPPTDEWQRAPESVGFSSSKY